MGVGPTCVRSVGGNIGRWGRCGGRGGGGGGWWWGWVVVGVLVIVASYPVGVWPRVSASSSGWAGVVPTPVLIGTIRWMPAEEGSLPDRNSGPAAAIPSRQRPWAERFADQIKARLYKPESTTRLDRWLFFRAARAESAEVLTDPTAVRGDLYRYVINAWLRQGRMSWEEERWARGVVGVVWEGPRALPQMSPVHVRITSVRRLVNDRPVRLRIGDRAYRVRGERIEPVGLRAGERWDGQVKIADFVRWPNFISTAPSENVRFHGVVFEGDEVLDAWWPVGEFERTVPVLIDADPVRTVSDDREIAAWLGSLRAVLRWEDGPESLGLGPVGVEVRFPDGSEAGLAGFTFGGVVALEVLWSGRKEYEQLAWAGAAWWALRDGVGEHGWRRIEGRGQWVPFEGGMLVRRDVAGPGDGEKLESARLVILQSEEVGYAFAPYWDLDAERVWVETVRLELTGHERARLERWLMESE